MVSSTVFHFKNWATFLLCLFHGFVLIFFYPDFSLFTSCCCYLLLSIFSVFNTKTVSDWESEREYWKIFFLLLLHFHRIAVRNCSVLIERWPFFSRLFVVLLLFFNRNSIHVLLACECGFMGFTRSANTLFSIEIHQQRLFSSFIILFVVITFWQIRNT